MRSERFVSGTPDQRIATIAGLQRGYMSRGQLLAAGIGAGAINRRIAKGSLFRVHRGVYAVGHLPAGPLGRETAALLALRDGAALSHHTAATIWGLSPRASDTWIHAIVDDTPAGRPVGVRVHRARNLQPRDLRLRRGVPVTSPARTLLDEAPSLSARELERAFDLGLVQSVMTVRDVDELLRRCGRHRGRRTLQAVRDGHTTTTFTRSEAEERFLALVRGAQLPPPLTNVRRHGYELDFLWPDRGIAVEIDGFAFHRTRRAFEDDRRKDATLSAAGIDTTRVTWRQLTGEPLAVIARLAQSLAR